MLGLVDKSSYDASWAQYYGVGLAYKDAFARQGSTFTLSWQVTDAAGYALTNTNVTLQANKGYGAANATFTINGLAVVNNAGANDGLDVAGVTDSHGVVSFTVTDTTQGSGEPSNTPTNAIDPLSAPGYTGGFYGQFGLQVGSLTELHQTMDIVEVHILGSNKLAQTITFPTLSAMTVGNSDQAISASSSAGSGYPVTLVATPSSVCSITNGLLHAISQGICSVTATQNGDDTYSSATPVIRSLTISPPPPTNYDNNPGTLLWSEDFTDPAGTAPDSSVWTALLGDGYNQLGFHQYGTGEIEQNSAAAAATDGNGNLVLTATKSGGTWTSSRIWTQGKVNFQYGQLEARILFPTGSFNWPAFWMLGSNYSFPNGLGGGTVPWPNSGEIDIAEGLGHNSVDQSTLHGNNPGGGDWNGGGGVTAVAPLNNISAGYHTFGMLWVPNSIAFTLDGLIFATDTFTGGKVVQISAGGTTTFDSGGVWPFNNPFFLILDNAIPSDQGSQPDGSTGSMKVDWIKYYAYQGYGAVTH